MDAGPPPPDFDPSIGLMEPRAPPAPDHHFAPGDRDSYATTVQEIEYVPREIDDDTPTPRGGEIDVPELELEDDDDEGDEEGPSTSSGHGHARADSAVLPPNFGSTAPRHIVRPAANTTTSPTTVVGSLIDMYHEREREAKAQPPLPSKLPVRTATTVRPLPSLPSPSSSPVPSSSSSESIIVSPPIVPSQMGLSPGVVLMPPPPMPLVVDPVRSGSPGRYVHGAPLHNVVEDEEED